MSFDEQTSEFAQKAARVYELSLKEQLESTHAGDLIALEPESGDYVLGSSFQQVVTAAVERFGDRPTHIFRVGGGGAVKIGVGRNARLS